ncbi:phasin family protein [Undibacterium arcticum]|uniref:Phasin family protein n=1 Tax=Undibacterium arcticum TaxID=1762892 RepID=A0ABV7F1R0_9BURK
MFSITERFTDAQRATWANLDAQLSMFSSLAVSTLDGVEQLVALNLALARSSFGASACTALQLCAAMPQGFFALTAQGPNLDTLQAYGRDLANASHTTQRELFIKTSQMPAHPTVATDSGQSSGSAMPTANAAADVAAKPLAHAVAESVTPDVLASDSGQLATASVAPDQLAAKTTVMEAAVTTAGPAASSKKLASKAIHAKQGDEAAAGKTAAAAQAAKLPARSSQPRLQGRKIPGKK